jgi:hypothetical protein
VKWIGISALNDTQPSYHLALLAVAAISTHGGWILVEGALAADPDVRCTSAEKFFADPLSLRTVHRYRYE